MLLALIPALASTLLFVATLSLRSVGSLRLPPRATIIPPAPQPGPERAADPLLKRLSAVAG